jgi:hypothetical protein
MSQRVVPTGSTARPVRGDAEDAPALLWIQLHRESKKSGAARVARAAVQSVSSDEDFVLRGRRTQSGADFALDARDVRLVQTETHQGHPPPRDERGKLELRQHWDERYVVLRLSEAAIG